MSPDEVMIKIRERVGQWIQDTDEVQTHNEAGGGFYDASLGTFRDVVTEIVELAHADWPHGGGSGDTGADR